MATSPAKPKPLRFTRDEFVKFFDDPNYEARKIILMDGEVIEIPKPGPRHDTGISLTARVLDEVFLNGTFVRQQMSLPYGTDTEPLPDISVVKGRPRDYCEHHPTSAVLVVEISENTAEFDLVEKMHLYAAARIPEYWVLDVLEKLIYIHRGPIADVNAPRGYRYAVIWTLTPVEVFEPLGFPEKTIRVADLLP